ncbi:MAG: PhoX family protein, partial [Gammaproteobacteria bacterium]
MVPPEYERYVIVHWGDRVFPHVDDYVGYNADYTAFLPIRGRDNDGYLWVNHEYVSYPLSSIAPAIPAGLNGRPTTDLAVLGFSLPTGAGLASLTPEERRLLLGEFSYNQGGSVIRIARANHKARFEVVRDPKNRRLHGLSGVALNALRTDGYQSLIAWGSAPHQQGDSNYLQGTGPAAREVFPLSSDGLGARIIGTAFNCSGATTPWQTVPSAEENFQGSSSSYMGVQENLLPNGTQTEYVAGTSGQEFGLVGEKYGWMVEVHPAAPERRPRKHTALGRFRHENITLWARPRKPLVAYMGDDRRGGHTWKFVSRSVLTDPQDKRNSRLLHEGTLFVAQFNPDGTGRWIPLDLTTLIDPVVPSVLGSAELAALGSISRDGNTRLPKRNGVAGQTDHELPERSEIPELRP